MDPTKLNLLRIMGGVEIFNPDFDKYNCICIYDEKPCKFTSHNCSCIRNQKMVPEKCMATTHKCFCYLLARRGEEFPGICQSNKHLCICTNITYLLCKHDIHNCICFKCMCSEIHNKDKCRSEKHHY